MAPLLPVRCRLLTDESLASLFIRLQLANQYEPNDWEWICRTQSGVRDAWWQPQQPVSWQMLASLTGITTKRLYLATFHAYMPALQLPWHTAATTYVARKHLPALTKWARHNYQRKSQTARYCPRCLAVAHYERLSWQTTLMLVCPKHHCLMHTACWNCRKTLQVRQLVIGACSHCRADLTATESSNVTQEQVHLQSQLLHLLRDSLPSPPVDWLQQPTPFLFELLRGFMATLPPHHHPATTSQLLEKQSHAISLLNRWPHNLYDYFDTLPLHKSGRVTSDFGILYRNWLEKRWQHPELESIQTVFDDYLAESYPPAFEVVQLARYKRRAALRNRLPYVSYDTAAATLGISRDFLWFAMHFGAIARYADKPIIGRAELQRIQCRWQDGIPLTDVILLLAIDVHYLDTIRALFSLEAAATAVPLGAFDALALALKPTSRASNNISQRATIDYWVTAMGLPLPELLHAILQGNIDADWIGHDLWQVSLWSEDVLTVFALSD